MFSVLEKTDKMGRAGGMIFLTFVMRKLLLDKSLNVGTFQNYPAEKERSYS